MEDITAELGSPDAREAPGRLSGRSEHQPERRAQRATRREGRRAPRHRRAAAERLAGTGVQPADDWIEVEWRLPLSVRGRPLGVMIARHVLPPGAKATRTTAQDRRRPGGDRRGERALYEGVMRRASEQEAS